MNQFINALVGATPHILLVFDTAQSDGWAKNGRAGRDAQTDRVIRPLEQAGVGYAEISIVSLTDVRANPKQSDFKYKAEYVKELIDTYAYNCCMPIGAKAFEVVTGLKGAAKYAGKVVESLVYPGLKVIPCPSPSAVKHNPAVAQDISNAVSLVAKERLSPDITPIEKLPTKYQILDSMDKVRFWYKHFMAQVDLFAYDLETTGLQFNKDEITTIQFSHRPGYSYLIPCNTIGMWPAAPNIWTHAQWSEVVDMLVDLFTAPGKIVIGHNKKFDDKFINHHWGIPLQKGRSYDTMIASFLCDENSANGLKELTCRFTDMGDYELELERFKDDYCKKHKVLKQASRKNPEKPVFSYGMIPFETLAPYALCDSDATLRLWYHFQEEMKKEGVTETFHMLMRITWLLTRFELNGWPVDVEYATGLIDKFRAEIKEIEDELMQHPAVTKASKLLAVAALEKENSKRKKKLTELKDPFVFNFSSPAQKSVLFFDVLKLPVVSRSKKTKKPSVDKEALTTWMRTEQKHREFLQNVQHYNELCKFLSTYVLGILSKVVAGRVHPNFNPIGAKTGRTSSSNPKQVGVVKLCELRETPTA